ncbi:hypothetical protein ACROYT_G031911 [Oculina patagonica]
MSEQVNIEALTAENQRLRQTLFVMVTDRKKMASKLTGVQNLGLQLQKKEQENKTLLEKNERLEGSLARAENRITQLSLQMGNGQQSGSQGAIVTPGVSKKVLEALTRDNTKLKQALDHLTNKGPAGVDLAVENRDLHEIIMTLRDERDLKSNEVNELKLALDAVKDLNTEKLKNQVLRLTALVTKLERNLNAKQVFCETVVTENESLKNDLQSLKDDRILQLREMKKELGSHTRSPEVQRILSRVYDNQDGEPEEPATSEEVNKLKDEVKKLMDELQSKGQDIEHLKAELDKTKEELTTAKDIHTAQQQSLQEELEMLSQRLRVLSDELRTVTRDRDQKEEQLNDQQMERELMQNALAGYENDFKMERQEKVKAVSDREQVSRERDQIVQRYEQLKQEHIGLRQNIERMYTQAQAQQQAKAPFRPGRTCQSQVQEPWQQQTAMRQRGFGMEACADGPAEDFTDSPTTPPKETPPPPRRYNSQGSQLQCPNCRKLFPHDLLENHMRDCTGDD